MRCSADAFVRAALAARRGAMCGAAQVAAHQQHHAGLATAVCAAGPLADAAARGAQQQWPQSAAAERAASHLWASTSAAAAAAARRHASHTHGPDAECAECGHDHSHTHHKHAHGGGTAAAAAHQQQHRQQQPPGGGDAAAAAAFEEQERACWSCHDRHKRGSLLCQACDRIQPVDSSLTHFDIMGIKEPTYDVDEASLERRYKLLQWSLHPDKAVGRTPQERGFSAEHAAHINMAYGVLRRPLSRANYLLMLAGVPAGDHFEGTLEDPELLMEVMEAREEVEATDDPHALESLLRSCQASQRRLEGELSGAFKARENGRAAALVAQLTYYVRLEEAIVAKM